MGFQVQCNGVAVGAEHPTRGEANEQMRNEWRSRLGRGKQGIPTTHKWEVVPTGEHAKKISEPSEPSEE